MLLWPIYYVCPLPPLSNLTATFLWLLTWHLPLDFYHVRFSQDLHMSHSPPLVDRHHINSTRSRVFKKAYSMEVHVCRVCPSTFVHLQRCLPMVIDWTPTLDLSHARFVHSLHMGHGLPPVGSMYRETQGAVRYLLYLSLHFGLLNRASSQIFSSCYLPMFLFRDKSFTLMNTASLIVLVKFCDSLPTVLKFSTWVWWPVMLILRCFLNVSPKVLADSPWYSSSQSTLSHLYLFITPLILNYGVLVFGGYKVLEDIASYEVYLDPMLQMFLTLSLSLSVQGTTMYMLFSLFC